MAACKKPTPAATSTPGGGRDRGSFAQANSAKLQKAWAEGIPGSGRGGGGKYFGKTKKKQPQNQTPATGQASVTESPAAKKAKGK